MFYELLNNPTFWVAIGFITVIAIIVFKARGAVLGSSYERIERILGEINSAESVREEAQELLVEQEKKYREVIEEAKEFVENAREEAVTISKSIELKTEETINQATARSHDAIKVAEVEAIGEIRKVALEKVTQVITTIAQDKNIGEKVIGNVVNDIRELKK